MKTKKKKHECSYAFLGVLLVCSLLCNAQENHVNNNVQDLKITSYQIIHAFPNNIDNAKYNLTKMNQDISELKRLLLNNKKECEHDLDKMAPILDKLKQEWEDNPKCQDDYLQQANSVFLNYINTKGEDICGINLRQFYDEQLGECSAKKLFYMNNEGDIRSIIDNAKKSFDKMVNEEVEKFKKEFERYDVGSKVTLQLNGRRVVTGRIQKINKGASLIVSMKLIPLSDLDEETAARVDDKAFEKLLQKKRTAISNKYKNSGDIERKVGNNLLEAGFFPDLTKDVHFAIKDFRFFESIEPDNWITPRIFITKISQKQYMDSLYSYYRDNGLMQLNYYDKDYWMTEDIRSKIRLQNEKITQLKNLEKLAEAQKRDIQHEEARILEEARKEEERKREEARQEEERKRKEEEARKAKIISDNLSLRGYENIYKDIKALIDCWLTDMSKGKPTGRYWHNNKIGEELFNVDTWSIKYDVEDFKPPQSMYRVPVNVNSTNRAGLPIRVTWFVTVITDDGLIWKILLLSKND